MEELKSVKDVLKDVLMFVSKAEPCCRTQLYIQRDSENKNEGGITITISDISDENVSVFLCFFRSLMQDMKSYGYITKISSASWSCIASDGPLLSQKTGMHFIIRAKEIPPLFDKDGFRYADDSSFPLRSLNLD